MNQAAAVRIGDCIVTVLHFGDVTLPLAEHMNVPPGAPAPGGEIVALAEQQFIPLQCVLIQTRETIVLVDAGAYEFSSDSYAIAGYQPPPGIAETLAAMGVSCSDIAHVVITHRHWDHFNGTTRMEGEVRVPRFPSATHHLGRADWERAREALEKPESLDARTLGVLHRHGLLRLVDEPHDLAPEVRILPSPGETPGHQVVRVHSRGETLYCVGDLYHHPAEFLDPAWMVSWADATANLASRRHLLKEAIPERAFLVAGHIPGIGRLDPGGTYASVPIAGAAPAI